MKERLNWIMQIWLPLPVWKRLDAAVILIGMYTVLVDAIVVYHKLALPRWLGDISLLNGILLGVLLGFRNREAYERWWEARKLWGQLINDSRSLCLKVAALSLEANESRLRFQRCIVGYAFALKFHLRGSDALAEVPGYEGEIATPKHAPVYILQQLHVVVRHWRTTEQIHDVDLLLLDPHLRGFADVCGACERILSSPVPMSYRALLRHGTLFYLLSAPWFLTGEYGFWAVAVVGLLAYFLLGIEFTAEDVEEPFGKDGDDLELTRFCHVIRESVDEIFDRNPDVANR